MFSGGDFRNGDDLHDWARMAAPGAAACLGVGDACPADVAPVVRALVDADLIDVARTRVAADRWRFIVQRRARIYARPDIAPVDARLRRGGLRARRAGTAERRILKLLLAAANRGLPCPTNAAIARAVGLPDGDAASYRLRKLAARGLIRVTVPGDPRLHRVVTITASGKSTRAGPR